MIQFPPCRIACLTLAVYVACMPMRARAVEVPNNVRQAVTAVLGSKREPDVELLTSTAFPADAELVPREVAVDHSTGTTRIKLSCVPQHRCLPFYVLVRGTDVMPTPTVPRRSPPDVRIGDRGALVNNSFSMRITLPVTALDAGRIGEIIRVRFEKRLVWRARVIGPGSFIAVTEVH